MKKLHCFVAVGVALCALTGCGLDQHPEYSPNVKYGLRTDPIVRDAAKLGEDRFDPDRPGILPIMHLKDIFDNPDNPIHAKAAKIDDAVLRDVMNVAHEKNKDHRRELEHALEKIFGTPAKPTVDAKDLGVDEKTIDALKLDDETLLFGSTRYRVHCMHCHGVPGDGRGPTARWINPHPRDFRQGIFKFQSMDQVSGPQRPPSRSDLLRTLRHGIEGTAMPSFNLLTDKELEALVSYVMHLSLRGKTEFQIFKDYFDSGKDGLVWNGGPNELERKIDAVIEVASKNLAKSSSWKESNDPSKAIKVAAYPYKEGDVKELAESVKRGQYLFLGDEKNHPRGKVANCKQCHDDYGRQARFKFDEWGTLVRPNNFTQGVFRGGRRPVDLYYRVHSGINGSGMTNFGKDLKGEDIWDLVNFVQTLAYPAMQKQLGINIH